MSETLLRMGGWIAADAGEVGERVDARAYAHPLLPGRVVVRVEPRSLGAAADAEMTLHGFAAPEVTTDVARGATRSVGLVGWAITNDPRNARVAIDLRRELEQAMRRAASKPGHAKDAIDAITKRLERALPRFVPPFCDDASRAFAELGNTTYAAQLFGRAREAERAHATKLDAELRNARYLEAALAGALTTKELGQYVKELAAEKDAVRSYELLRELAIRRTLGGVPPWSGMPGDLRKMAAAAGLDVAREDERVIEELLAAPSMARAPIEVWSGYAEALGRLGARKPEARIALLAIVPVHPRRYGDDKGSARAGAWLRVLEQAGAIALVTCPPAEAPGVAAGAWLSRLLDSYRDADVAAPDAMLELVRTMRDRLVAEGAPLRVLVGRHPQLDVDLAELALSLGIPLAAPALDEPALDDDEGDDDWGPGAEPVDLRAWSTFALDPARSAYRGVDPIHLARDPRYGPLLESAFAAFAKTADFARASAGKQAFAELRRRWVAGRIDALGEGTLATFERGLGTLERGTTRRTFQDAPELFASLRAIDPARALATTLRAGLLEELAWPALEEALRELDPSGTRALAVHPCWPCVLVSDGVRAITVGPTRIERRDELKLAKREMILRARWVEGEVLVVVGSGKTRAHWLGAPKRAVATDAGWHDGAGYVAHLPGLGASDGGIALRAGAEREPERGHRAVFDGTTLWTDTRRDGALRLIEVDPRTGEHGRVSAPRFFEEARDGAFDVYGSWLTPAPAGLGASPLGLRDGMLGTRVTLRGRTGRVIERIDGVRIEVTHGLRGRRTALVDLPARTHHLVVTEDYADLTTWTIEGSGARLVQEIQEREDGGSATSVVPSGIFLHFTQPRDLEGSQALARIDEARAAAVLEHARGATGASSELENALAAVRAVLPEITAPALLDAVAGIVARTLAQADALDALIEARDPEGEGDREGALHDDDVIEPLARWLDRHWGDGAFEPFLRRLARVLDAFDRGQPVPRWGRTVPSNVHWSRLIGARGALAMIATSPLIAAAERTVLTDVIALLEALPLERWAHRMRTFEARPSDAAKASLALDDVGDAHRIGITTAGASVFVMRGTPWAPTWHVVELAREGAPFTALPGCTMQHERVLAAPPIVPIAALVRARGLRTLDAAGIDALAEACSISRAEALLVLGGLLTSLPRTREEKRAIAPVRDALGLKAAAIDAAIEELDALPFAKRSALMLAALPADPAAPWDDPRAHVQHLAARWAEVVGRRVTVAPELSTRAGKALSLAAASRTLAALLAPDDVPVLAVAPRCAIDVEGVVVALDANGAPIDDGRAEVFDETMVTDLARLVAWAFVELPVGDPLRAGIPRLIAKVRERLASRDLLFMAGRLPFSSPSRDEAVIAAQAQAHVDALGGTPFDPIASTLDADDDEPLPTLRGRDTGLVLALPTHWDGIVLAFRPSEVARGVSEGDAALLAGTRMLPLVRWWLSDGLSELAARVASTPVPTGRSEADPRLSDSALVAKVASALGVSSDAATYYLQLLALAEPTDDRVLAWNGWKRATLRAAGEELERAELVVRGKRARAGRELFLPGPWEERSAPELPLERWKLPLYGGETADARTWFPLGRVLALRPLHALFDEAWARLERGDRPQLEDARSVVGKRAKKTAPKKKARS
ncbi:hypothetical protein [Sandaracinus amylolyticus]|uniref:hypothetical protein n=1 Tax=Sandaracinus amylolyticus TaxID=927083 RepID=UPI001F3D41B3|nr:hypothetical protein [Sandaracinus amylolyticus]UJR85121.1 Hypothetical protein I5071_72010 [Sandaracinus amylolyticus]